MSIRIRTAYTTVYKFVDIKTQFFLIYYGLKIDMNKKFHSLLLLHPTIVLIEDNILNLNNILLVQLKLSLFYLIFSKYIVGTVMKKVNCTRPTCKMIAINQNIMW